MQCLIRIMKNVVHTVTFRFQELLIEHRYIRLIINSHDIEVLFRPIMDTFRLCQLSLNCMPKIVNAVENIMSTHKNEKGIIHTTSYSQLQFIKDNIGRERLHADRNGLGP